MNKEDVLKIIIEENKDKFWDLSAKIIDYIYSEAEDMQQRAFTDLLVNVDIREFDLPEIDEKLTLSNEQYKVFLDVSKTAERILQNLINANITESEFYEKLWIKFNDKDLFTSSDDRIALLLSLWLDVRIPYFQLHEGCSMEDDEYRKYIDEISLELKKASFIVYKNMKQKTQRVSLLMELAESISDKNKRTVFWSYVISLISKKEAELYIARSSKAENEKKEND